MNNKHSFNGNKRRTPRSIKRSIMFCCLALLSVAVVGGSTLAYLIDATDPVENTFVPTELDCEIDEEFDEITGVKSSVKIENTGNVDAFIRVKLLPYWYDEAKNQIVGKSAWDLESELELNTNDWFYCESDGFYYHRTPVAPDDLTSEMLNAPIELKKAPDGTRMALEIIAEAVQSQGKNSNGNPAATEAWGVTVDDNNTSADYSDDFITKN